MTNTISLFNQSARRLALDETVDTNTSFAPQLSMVDFDVTAPQANLVTSIGQFEDLHYPVLDLDFRAHLQPSSTPGHSHLYLDRPLTWTDYVLLLTVMQKVGLIEAGYVDVSLKRGHTSVRLPWVAKGKWKKAS